MNMNKLFGIFLLVLLVLFVSACSKQADTVTTPQDTVGVSDVKPLSEDIDSVDQELGEMDKLSQDLSTDELDVLDEELAQVETAEMP